MTTKVISFLGYTPPDKRYQRTTYVFEGEPYPTPTPFMSEAAAHFFKPDELLILVTAEAKGQNFGDLVKNLEGVITPTPVDIPSGKHEHELWQIFAAMSERIQPGDRIIFDITNGFRSLPVLAFLAASFVQIVRQAQVERMVYGAFDAQDKGKGLTPVFDLTPFVRLLEWTTATNTFLKTGRFTDVGSLLKNPHEQHDTDLSKLADLMSTVSRGLHTSRPTHVMEQSHQLVQAIDQFSSDTQDQTQPFRLLLENIRTEYSQFGLENLHDKKELLKRLLKMIDWYVEKDLLIQAMTLAREWLVSLVVYYQGGDIFDDQRGNAKRGVPAGDRQQAEAFITGHQKDIQPSNELRTALPKIRDFWQQISDINQEQSESRKDVGDIRNDLAHCGMRSNPRSPDEIASAVRGICKDLQQLMPA
ncbi:MAG: TIGR02221 family CRISPR-associated protein [Chloroflexaceae bacterium]|nr:TIGR02221 family CRISPR-associated protein [Chloroflexaceae bacterium]